MYYAAALVVPFVAVALQFPINKVDLTSFIILLLLKWKLSITVAFSVYEHLRLKDIVQQRGEAMLL